MSTTTPGQALLALLESDLATVGGAPLITLLTALQAAKGDLELELLARRQDDRAQIVVSDNGPGVPEQLRQKIFDPFFTTRARGNGIGLAIVKSVVEAHKGSVRLADSGRGADEHAGAGHTEPADDESLGSLRHGHLRRHRHAYRDPDRRGHTPAGSVRRVHPQQRWQRHERRVGHDRRRSVPTCGAS